MVRVNDLEIPVQEIGEIMGRRTRRAAKVATALTILAAKTFHSTRPYAVVSGLAGMGLGIAPFFISAPQSAKIAMQMGSLPLSLVSAQIFLKQADEDEQRDDDEQFYRNLNREAYRDTQAMTLEAQYLALREQSYEGLPLHARPDRYDFTEFAKGKQSAGQAFMANAEAAMKQAFADLPDDEGEGMKAIAAAGVAAAAQNDKSLLISGVSGVGKTYFLRHCIHAINAAYEGSQVFVGVDFKGSTGHFCGLERSESFITSPAPGRDYKFAAAAIGDVVEMLGNRDEDFPLYLLCDEINNGLEQAKCQGASYGRKPEEVLKSNLKFIATQGRERLIRGILTAHGNLMSMLGIDGDTAQSLVCAVLGRKVDKGDGFGLVDKVLKNQVLFSKDESQRLRAEFNQVRAIVEPTGQAIALTNIEGDWEFVLLPTWYKNDPGRLQGEAQNQSVTQLIKSLPPPVVEDEPTETEQEVKPPVSVVSVPEPDTLKPFLDWAIGLPFDNEGWVSIPESFPLLPELLSEAYPSPVDFAKFLILLKKLDAVELKAGLEAFKLTQTTIDKLTQSEAIEFDSEVYSRLQNWMTGTGSKYFKNGVIEVRTILANFKLNGLRLDSSTVRFYCDQLVSDGLGEWVLTDTQKFHLYFLTDSETN
jgi:hypothetical protein